MEGGDGSLCSHAVSLSLSLIQTLRWDSSAAFWPAAAWTSDCEGEEGRKVRCIWKVGRWGWARESAVSLPPPLSSLSLSHRVRLGLDLGQELAEQGLLVLLEVDVLCEERGEGGGR
jgi:hypothetical protein